MPAAIPVTMNASAKRRRAPEEDFPEFDSENVDPLLLSPSKKAKGHDGAPAKPPRPQQYVLKANGTSYSAPTHAAPRVILTPKRHGLSTSAAKPASSAPAVAGRSPTKKRAGILSRRRVSASPFTRVDPPAFGLAGPGASASAGNGLPFSIDAALSGTVPTAQPPPAAPPLAAEPAPVELPGAVPRDDMPRAWLFDIHEDTPDEELGNLMEFSTQTLDLSSDDERTARAREARGKENVPPENLASTTPAVASAAASRKDQMTDEPRTPLADLDAREFYAAGCDANSFVIVPAEPEDAEAEKARFAFAEMVKEEVRTPCPVDGQGENQDAWQSLLARVDAGALAGDVATPLAEAPVVDGSAGSEGPDAGSPPPIEIWESESAKDESEDKEGNVIAVTETLAESLAAAEAKVEAVEQALSL